ncbi:MAG TPA: response regulator [Chryseosolibacter sp.]|nr:response regulator [Chryseosolibacter sp.]
MRRLKNKPHKILVIEDDPDILNALNIALASVGFDVDVMLRGKSIFLNQFSVPDLFILDKQLPDVDGLEVCRYLKSKPPYQNVPVIVISASPKVKKKALECGAAVFMEKPFVMHDLVKTIKTTLHLGDGSGGHHSANHHSGRPRGARPK